MKTKSKMSLIAAAVIMTSVFAFTAPQPKEEKTYVIDTHKTTATWLGTKVTGKHSGNITIADGKITSDGKNITGGSVEFDMTSMTCTDLTDKEWSDKLVGHLKSDDFFGVAKYPTSQFEITKATLKSENNYDITGKLTIKGITNEITFPAFIKFDEKTIVTIAKITVDRTKYGIKYGSSTFFEKIGDKAIGDNFELDVDVVAEVATH